MPKTCGHPGCAHVIRHDSQTGLCGAHYREKTFLSGKAEVSVEKDLLAKARHHELATLRKKYDNATRMIENLQSQLTAVGILNQGFDSYTVQPANASEKRDNEAVAVLVASDFHIEEQVGDEVGGLNTYDLDIARHRIEKFFRSGLRLINLLNQDIQINTVILALLGDFITNDIRDELTDLVQAPPMNALVIAQNHLVSGIQFLLNNSTYEFIVPCHSGNHARTTKTTHFSAENGHSLEYLMYLWLQSHFRNEPRMKFIIPEGYHSYVKVFDKTIRFHHGHAIKYQGGIGGIFIPGYKAISQWNKGRPADLDVFGHFHQQKDGGNFLSNGSLIGYNGYALSIKADFEVPKQLLFLMDRKRGRTATWPIYV